MGHADFETMNAFQAINHMHGKSYFKETGNGIIKNRMIAFVLFPFKLVLAIVFFAFIFAFRFVRNDSAMVNKNPRPKKKYDDNVVIVKRTDGPFTF